MTADKRDELRCDLERAGVYAQAIEPREPTAFYPREWQVRAWNPDPAHFYTVTDAARFRQAVRDGRTELPPGALD
jgi:hypothetical protein